MSKIKHFGPNPPSQPFSRATCPLSPSRQDSFDCLLTEGIDRFHGHWRDLNMISNALPRNAPVAMRAAESLGKGHYSSDISHASEGHCLVNGCCHTSDKPYTPNCCGWEFFHSRVQSLRHGTRDTSMAVQTVETIVKRRSVASTR